MSDSGNQSFSQSYSVSVDTQWPADATADAQLVNQFLLSQAVGLASGGQDDVVYLAFGHSVMPTTVSAEDLSTAPDGAKVLPVPVHVRSSVVLTYGRLRELHGLLSGILSANEEVSE